PIIAGKRGTAEFETPTEGTISLAALRSVRDTLNWIPVLSDSDNSGGSFANVMFSREWRTRFTLVNLGGSAAPATLNFFDSFGAPLNVSLVLPQSAQTITTSALNTNLLPGATLIAETSVNDLPALVSGSVQLNTTGNVNGLITYRQSSSAGEIMMPLETRR